MKPKSTDRIVDDLATSIRLIVRRLRAESDNDLSWTQSAVLRRLVEDGPATTADLARAENMKPQSMGATVTGLEDMGLIARKPHPTDGRQMNLVVTDKGRALRERIHAAKRSWLAGAVGTLDAKEREILSAASIILRRLGENP